MKGKDLTTRTCYKCIYFKTCGDIDITEPCDGKYTITESQAKEFFRDLQGTVYQGDSSTNKPFTEEEIADHMRISIEKANEFLWACARYGITERQGGFWVV